MQKSRWLEPYEYIAFFCCRRFGFCGIAEVKGRTSAAGFNPLKIFTNIRVSRNDHMSSPVERGL